MLDALIKWNGGWWNGVEWYSSSVAFSNWVVGTDATELCHIASLINECGLMKNNGLIVLKVT